MAGWERMVMLTNEAYLLAGTLNVQDLSVLAGADEEISVVMKVHVCFFFCVGEA